MMHFQAATAVTLKAHFSSFNLLLTTLLLLLFEMAARLLLQRDDDNKKGSPSQQQQRWRIRQFRLQLNEAAKNAGAAGIVYLRLRRANLVNDVLAWFQRASDAELLSSTRVKFEGEEAVDAGGVTANMYTEVMNECCRC